MIPRQSSWLQQSFQKEQQHSVEKVKAAVRERHCVQMWGERADVGKGEAELAIKKN